MQAGHPFRLGAGRPAAGEEVPEGLELPCYGARPRSARRLAAPDGRAVVEHGVDVFAYAPVDALELVQGEGFKRKAPGLGKRHGPAGDVVRLAEGNALAHEVVGHLGGVEEALGKALLHALRVEADFGEHAFHDGKGG